MIRVKICGITNWDDAAAAVAAGADALGFIFYPPSKRGIAPAAAGAIIRRLPPLVSAIGVFVDETAEHIENVRRQAGFGAAQLSGDEAPELTSAIGIPVIKCFRAPPPDPSLWRVSGFIADGAQPGHYGGTGTAANDAVIEALAGPVPVILAGGLTPGNVAERIRRWRPYGVDVASGVEAEPGRKDHRKLAEFIAAAKAA